MFYILGVAADRFVSDTRVGSLCSYCCVNANGTASVVNGIVSSRVKEAVLWCGYHYGVNPQSRSVNHILN